MPIARILIAALLFLAVSASASAAPLATHTRETVSDVSWTLPADQCASLPAGVTVNGTGERTLATNTRVNADGSSQIVSNDLVKGVAWGSDGSTYTFVYQNHSTEEVPASGSNLPHRISMNDSFVLNGQGAATHMTVGFNWRWTYTPPEASWPPMQDWQQLSTRGAPFLCDPI